MKRISIHRILAVFVAATLFFAGCTKESSDVRLNPQLSTSQVLNVKSDAATVVAFVVASVMVFQKEVFVIILQQVLQLLTKK